MKQPISSQEGTMKAGWSWKDEPELMARLAAMQNARDTQDITTIVGCFTNRAELEARVTHYERKEGR